ncbi:hypothetical protein WR25_24868 [Diploscapter pachys]|uniref:Uncharacterized protein n=1 Tax=Diploscapter pachys TaxID=2018661 RepID=A0A2A2L4L4_9BILA|nr:hypothetical protein WR25_24868 [Diploscapter pachys]
MQASLALHNQELQDLLAILVQEGIAKALSNLQLAISVVSTSKDPVTIANITDCLPAYSQFSALNLMRAMTNTKTLIRERVTVSKSTVFNANNVNFIILIEKDPSVCAMDRSILAAAKPCPIRQRKR